MDNLKNRLENCLNLMDVKDYDKIMNSIGKFEDDLIKIKNRKMRKNNKSLSEFEKKCLPYLLIYLINESQ